MPRRVVRRDEDELMQLTSTQDGVVSRSQLCRLGWNHDHVQRAVAGGRWAAYGAHAVALHRGPLTTRQTHWIAVINGGPTATLAGLTAAEELGLDGFSTPRVHIVVAGDAWVPRHQPGVNVHRSRRFTVSDRHPARRLPTVRIERALVDAAAWSQNARRASALLIAGVQQRLTRPDRLRDALFAAGRIRHRRVLLAVLDDVAGGVHALSELDFTRLCRRHGLPEPARQQRRPDAYGRVRYLDVRFVRSDGRVLNIEIDGAAHFRVLDAWADMERDLALLIQGERTVRVPSVIVRTDEARLADAIRTLLEAPW